ncbi:hypothetical protein HW555_013706, partial [Spodoptera exigua]
DELQKKWKHLRDYYVKEKQDNTRSGSAAPKKRKNSYIELLRFLDVVKESRVSSGNISAPAGDNDQNENSCDEISTNTNTQPRNANAQETVTENFIPPQTEEVSGTSQMKKKPKMTAFQQSLITAMNKKQQSPKAAEEDADTKFLLSLLPQIKSLNERQNCEFRMEVMNLIYKLKYRNSFNMSHNQTYSYNHPGYSTYEQSPTTYSIPTGDMSPPVYQGYTTNSNSAISYSTIQSPESIETQRSIARQSTDERGADERDRRAPSAACSNSRAADVSVTVWCFIEHNVYSYARPTSATDVSDRGIWALKGQELEEMFGIPDGMISEDDLEESDSEQGTQEELVRVLTDSKELQDLHRQPHIRVLQLQDFRAPQDLHQYLHNIKVLQSHNYRVMQNQQHHHIRQIGLME